MEDEGEPRLQLLTIIPCHQKEGEIRIGDFQTPIGKEEEEDES